MLTKETLTADVQELREQFHKAQQQFLLAKQQSNDFKIETERLRGAILATERYLIQLEQ